MSGSISWMREKTQSSTQIIGGPSNWTFTNFVIIIVKCKLYMMAFSLKHTYRI
jgi:hypothetical protein